MRNNATDIYMQTREKILAGEYPPATALIETDLAEQYGVSRNTVKKVLLMLESKGLVSIEPNKSAKVRSFTLAEVLEYMQIREVMEGLIVHLAIPHITEPQIERLQEALERMKGHLEKRELLAYSEENKRFHQVIYDACPNRTAVDIVLSLKSQISKFNAKTILISGRDEQSYREHVAILGAITSRDADTATLLMRRHIYNVAQTMREYDQLLF